MEPRNLSNYTWENSVKLNEEGIEEIKDICDGIQIMEEKSEEKYLGDVISTDGKNIKNVKSRVSKGKGIVSRILAILDSIPLGQFYFEVALLLRNSLLVSSMLSNSEAWYNVKQAELNLLETIDHQFLRSILKAPKSTALEMLYLELGCIPFSKIIMKRRILFAHYILNEKENSLLNRFFKTQLTNKHKKDWVTQVQNDLSKLDICQDFESLKQLKRVNLKCLLDKAIKEHAFQELTKKKENHSKVMNIKHKTLEMQKYLKTNKIATIEDSQEIFKIRSKVTDVKINFKGKYDSFECFFCDEEESQKHVMECKYINKNQNHENFPKCMKKFLKMM